MRIKNENDTLRYENDNENEGDGESENYVTTNSKIRLIRDKQIRDYEKRNSTLGYTDLAQHIISNCYRTGCYQLHAWAIVLRTTTDNGQQTTDNGQQSHPDGEREAQTVVCSQLSVVKKNKVL